MPQLASIIFAQEASRRRRWSVSLLLRVIIDSVYSFYRGYSYDSDYRGLEGESSVGGLWWGGFEGLVGEWFGLWWGGLWGGLLLPGCYGVGFDFVAGDFGEVAGFAGLLVEVFCAFEGVGCVHDVAYFEGVEPLAVVVAEFEGDWVVTCGFACVGVEASCVDDEFAGVEG